MNSPSTWFRHKTIGIGWTPATWKGWAVTAAIVGVAALLSRAR